MSWLEGDQVYGMERYLPNRRVLWTNGDDICTTGYWYSKDQTICFVYDNEPAPICWEIHRSAEGLIAHDLADSPGEPILILETVVTETPRCFADAGA